MFVTGLLPAFRSHWHTTCHSVKTIASCIISCTLIYFHTFYIIMYFNIVHFCDAVDRTDSGINRRQGLGTCNEIALLVQQPSYGHPNCAVKMLIGDGSCRRSRAWLSHLSIAAQIFTAQPSKHEQMVSLASRLDCSPAGE